MSSVIDQDILVECTLLSDKKAKAFDEFLHALKELAVGIVERQGMATSVEERRNKVVLSFLTGAAPEGLPDVGATKRAVAIASVVSAASSKRYLEKRSVMTDTPC